MPNTGISGGRVLLLPKLECHYDGERRNGRLFVSVFMLGAMKVSPSPPPQSFTLIAFSSGGVACITGGACGRCDE